MRIDLDQIDLIAADVDATVDFYRALGVEIPDSAIWRTASGAHHVDFTMPSGLIMHFDSEALARAYDSGWRPPKANGTRSVLNFKVPSRDDVDALHARMVERGSPSTQPPFDAFWGARYAIVEDPDGHHVGIMSASDPARRAAPPDL